MTNPDCRELAELYLLSVKGCTEKDIDKLARAIEDLCSNAQDEIELRERATNA